MDPADLGVTADLTAITLSDPSLSAIAILCAIALRWIASRVMRARRGPMTDGRRWWLSLTRNLVTTAALFALIAIWADELRDAALSLAAFAVAAVIATKELLLCLAGAIWRGASGSYSVGDWVEIGEHSGEVTDVNMLSTTIQHLDPHDFTLSGRVISFPNSMLLTAPVINQSFRKRFLFLDWTIHSVPRPDVMAVREAVQRELVAASEDFAELARRYAQRIESTTGSALGETAPRVSVETTELGNVVFRRRLFRPRDRATQIRETAIAAFLATPVEA